MTCFSGGWNNNPTALHFKAAYHRLICHIGASGATGNVRSQDDTELVNSATPTYVSPRFVVRKAEKCIKCVDCRSVLSKHSTECGRDTSNVLFNYRQLGGLIMPSDDVKIVTFAELQLRCLSPLNRATLQCTSRKLQASVLQQFGDKLLFDIENHFSETQSGIDNHYFDLLRVIVDIFGGCNSIISFVCTTLD